MNTIYLLSILICVVASLGMCLHTIQSSSISRDNKHWFACLYLSLALCSSMECLGVYLDITAGGYSLLRLIVKLIEFILIPVLPVFMAFGCGLIKEGKPIWYLACGHALIELILCPFQKIIMVNELGVYHRGPWYFIYITISAISTIYLLNIFGNISKKFSNRNLTTIISVFLLILSGVGPSIVKSEYRVSMIGVSIASIVLYLYYEGLTLQDKMDALSKQNEYIQMIQKKIIIGVADLIESRDMSTGTHVKDTAYYAKIILEEAIKNNVYGIDSHYADLVYSAAPLHDVGKIIVSDTILLKPGKLTDEEFEIMKAHTTEGGKIIKNMFEDIADGEYIQIAYDIAKHHHEKWNGKGYPDGLSGTDIPLAARIVAIADVYDALISKRTYKDSFPIEEALSIIEKDSGTHFDPILAPLFVERMRKETQK